MSFSDREINLGIIVSKYEEELIKSEKALAFKVILMSSVDDLDSVNSITESSLNLFPGTKYSENTPSTKEEQKEIDIATLKNLNLENIDPETLKDYLKKCLNCNGRIQFDFQLNPDVNIAASFESLVKDVNLNLGFINKTFNKERDLSQICAVIKLFEGISCPQDLLMMVLAFKVLLKQYAMSALSLKFDWLTLFGPIIQGIAQILSALTNMLFSVIESPLDCLMAAMQANLSLIRELNPEAYSTSKNLDSAVSVDNIEANSYGLGTKSYSLPQFKDLTKTNTPIIPSGGSLDLSLVDLINMDNGETFNNMSFPEKIMTAFGEARSNITKLKEKILDLINNLNGLVKKGKLFEIKNISIILLIVDIIGFLIELMKTDFNNIFDSCENNPESLEGLIQSLNPNYEAKINKVDNGYSVSLSSEQETKTIYINSCSKASSTENLNYISKMIENIENKINE